MGVRELLHKHREAILAIAARHGARNVRVFGSVARGEATEESDVDFLVELDADRSLMDLGGLLADLEELLGRKVDVVEPDGLHPYLKPRILEEAVAL